MTEHPLLEILTKLQYDLTSIQARLADLKREIAKMPVDQQSIPYACPIASCGITRTSARLIDEHLENVHGIQAQHEEAA